MYMPCVRLTIGIVVAVMVFLIYVASPSVATAVEAQQGARTLCLNASEPTNPDYYGGPMLVRELIRQGILIAAREDLGLSTRDAALREPFPTDPAAAGAIVLDVAVIGQMPVKARITFAGAGGQVLWEGMVLDDHWRDDDCVEAMIDATDRLSRVEWLDALRKAGIGIGPPPAKAAHAPAASPTTLPTGVEENLATMEIIAQFSAARQLHREIHAAGSSAELTGALVRAYANLGELTAFHWTAAHKVFKARSLHYANRMVKADEKSAWARWHRAYARALAGYHALAMDDLKAAELSGDRSDSPGWVALIGPFCRYETGKLTDLASHDAKSGGLATFFAYLSVAHSRSDGAIMNLARSAGKINPECLRLIDDMCNYVGPGMGNSLTELGPSTFSNTLGRRLESLAEMPEPIVKLIKSNRRPGGNPSGRAAVVEALLEQGAAGTDNGEPSWSALARLIQETTFVQTWRRANHIRHKWGVDASDYVQEMLPLLADHPYRNFIAKFALEPATKRDEIAKLLESVVIGDVGILADPMTWQMDQMGIKNAGGGLLWTQLWAHMDCVAQDHEDMIIKYWSPRGGNEVADNIKRLRSISPYSPLPMAYQITFQWESAKASAAEWEKSYGDQPAVVEALARKYRELEKWPEAERNYARWIALAPDHQAYFGLANVYEKQDRPEKMIETLIEFVQKGEDFGLHHAQAQVRIAEYYMTKRDWPQATQYADAAARTGAAWATSCAEKAHELAGNWDQVEALVQERSGHYRSAAPDWYFWCRKTGLGHVVSAQRQADEWADEYRSATSPEYIDDIAHLYRLEDKRAEARDFYRKSFDRWPNAVVALHMALLSEQLNDPAQRDEILKNAAGKISKATTKGSDKQSRPKELEELMDELSRVFADEKAILDPAKVEEWVRVAPTPARRSYVRYFAAWFYRLRGDDDRARELLSAVVREGPRERFTTTLAWVDLRELGVEPIEIFNAENKAPATQPK